MGDIGSPRRNPLLGEIGMPRTPFINTLVEEVASNPHIQSVHLELKPIAESTSIMNGH